MATKQQIPVLTGAIVSKQDAFASLPNKDTQWAIENTEEAIRLSVEAIINRNNHGETLPQVSIQQEKFVLLLELGIITVPNDYVHDKALDLFGKKNRGGFLRKGFFLYDDNIIDVNFSNPSRVLRPGDKFRVTAFQQIVSDRTTSEERLAFLATQKAVLVGAQGLTLMWNQKRDKLPQGKTYLSFDEKSRLWKNPRDYGDYQVPGIIAQTGGLFGLTLRDFSSDYWGQDDVILCFCAV